DRGMLDAGAVAVDTQEDRGRAYAHYLDALAGLPYFVGCHWFQYIDQAFLGRHDGFESSNVGFVDVTDSPYPELVNAASRANAFIYQSILAR
ncbi:MAG: agarase, partial [Candidatus Omnitrophica bacterium]|nr:agarase [Candidatus Omnitrophota bacterium]